MALRNERYTVTLTCEEIQTAAIVGVRRHVSALAAGRHSTAGIDFDWQVNIQGALAECATAKHLNQFWSGALGNLRAADVGSFQVRHSLRHDRCLLIRDRDPDDAVFIFVTGGPTQFCFRGWIYGRQGKRPGFRRDPHGDRPAFFVPIETLEDMATLPDFGTPDIPF